MHMIGVERAHVLLPIFSSGNSLRNHSTTSQLRPWQCYHPLILLRFRVWLVLICVHGFSSITCAVSRIHHQSQTKQAPCPQGSLVLFFITILTSLLHASLLPHPQTLPPANLYWVFFSLRIVHWGFIWIIACINSVFLFVAELYWMT